jgi:DNA-binding NtrC family response regulator
VAIDCRVARSRLDCDHLLDCPSQAAGAGATPLGTIFFNAVHAVSPEHQGELLRFVEQQSETAAGDGPAAEGPLRIVAASEPDLMEEAEAGRFREDLYYHLSVVTIRVPPLRERRADIPDLVSHFLAVYGRKNGRRVTRVEPAAMKLFEAYNWPGNLREMRSYVERAIVLAPGEVLACDLLPEPLRSGKPHRIGGGRAADPETLAAELIRQGLEAADSSVEDVHARIIDPIERELLAQVMAACGNVQVKAADRLGMNRNTLRKKLKDYGLEK